MSKRKGELGNCRRCGKSCLGKHRICFDCKEKLHQLEHDLDLIKRYPSTEKFDEDNMYEKES